jgi:hypothetical protein
MLDASVNIPTMTTTRYSAPQKELRILLLGFFLPFVVTSQKTSIHILPAVGFFFVLSACNAFQNRLLLFFIVCLLWKEKIKMVLASFMQAVAFVAAVAPIGAFVPTATFGVQKVRATSSVSSFQYVAREEFERFVSTFPYVSPRS